MSSLWGFAYGDDEMVPISVGAARLAAVIGDKIREQSDDEVIAANELWPVSTEFSIEAYRSVAAFLELQKNQPLFRIRRPLMDNGNLEYAGVPPWALNFINSIVISTPVPSSSSSSSATDTSASCSSSSTTLVQVDWNRIFDMLKIADLYNIHTLIHLTASKIASRICGYSENELERIFHHDRVYTPEEEAQIRTREAWAETEPDLEEELKQEELLY